MISTLFKTCRNRWLRHIGLLEDHCLVVSSMTESVPCVQWPKGLCRRHETCKFYHAPLTLPELRPGQCSWLINGAKRCQNNANFIENGCALCFDHTAAGKEERGGGKNQQILPERATKRVSGKGRMVDPFQVGFTATGEKAEVFVDLVSTFTNPALPIIIDVGCAQGRFLLQMAQRHQDVDCHYNYIGYELRGALVEAANEVVRNSPLEGSVVFIQGEAKSILDSTVSTLLASSAQPPPKTSDTDGEVSVADREPNSPNGAYIQWLTIQFPDPWTKKKHHKRRLVDAQFVSDCARLMSDARSYVYICSDRYDLACYMYDTFAASALWQVVPNVEDLPIGSSVVPAVALVERLPAVSKSSCATVNEARAGGNSSTGADDSRDGVSFGSDYVDKGGAHGAKNGSDGDGKGDGDSVDSTEAWCQEVYRAKDADDVRGWLSRRPFAVGTERDTVAERQNRPVHRAAFRRVMG